jgi:ribonuclease P protein component
VLRHDADISPAEQAPDRPARFPEADGRPLGPCRVVAPPQEGAEAAHGHHRLEARSRLNGDERFGRSRRLGNSDLRRVLADGRRRRGPRLDIHWIDSSAGHPRAGIVVPRFQQTAVARNRLRRRLGEIWRRRIQPQLPPWDVVIRARREAYAAPLPMLEADLLAWRAAATA